MKEKITKKNNGRGIDRLSNLPDAILLHILSFLPTKTCVNTMSLVSHRYRNLWEHLQVLNVNEKDFYNLNLSSDLELFRYLSLFMNGFLACCKSPDIHKFHLSFDLSGLEDDDISAPYTWVCIAIGPRLEELHLSLHSDEGTFNFPLDILSSCPNLLSLSLSGDIIPISGSAVCLPLLKKLIIDYVDVPFLDKLPSCCPVLEILEVFFCLGSLTTLRVPHFLKRLKLESYGKAVGTYLEIDAPGLKYLSLKKITFKDNAIGDLHKVDEAYLNVFSPHSETISVDPLLDLLRVLSGIKHLVLDCSKWLFDAEFPEFQYLIHLELILPCFNISFLYQVLQKCNMLQRLKIKMHKNPLAPLYEWAPKPKSVSNCLVSHLTFIRFIGCQGYLDEIKFIRYVLRNRLVLKTMHISSLSKVKWVKDNILRQFFYQPRGSVSCQVEFD